VRHPDPQLALMQLGVVGEAETAASNPVAISTRAARSDPS
jgi:hypothetical protein